VSSKSQLSKSSKKITSMADLLASYETKPKRFSLGERVEGTVIDKLPNALVLDIGGKSEGMVAEKAYAESKDFIKHLEVGDKVIGRVIVSENPQGYTILSLRDASKDYFWNKLENLENGGDTVTVLVKGVNPSGVIVDIYGLSGFIPASHLGKEIVKNLSKITGESVKAKIIELDKSADRIVLSERAVSEKEEIIKQKEALKAIKKGDIYKGEITTVADFGVFVKIKVPYKKEEIDLEGLVHISELAWEKVGKPQDKYKVGDKVEVKVIDFKGATKKSLGKLSLSIKQAVKDPWEDVEKKYKNEMKLTGIVVKKSDFGVFVELEPGVEGLIHMTKIPPGKRLKEGDNIEVYIEEVNPEEKRISLGLVLTEKPVGYK